MQRLAFAARRSVLPSVVTLLAILVLSNPLAASATSDASPGDTVHLSTMSLEIVGATDDQASTIVAAAHRFEATDLRLPDLHVIVHRDSTACHGHDGYWTPGPSRDRIDLCVIQEVLVLHEMAHAWDHHAVSDATRAAFMGLHPGDAWRQDGTHRQQGIERFADAVAWGLLAAPVELGAIDETIRRRALERRAAAFEVATGRPAPRLQR